MVARLLHACPNSIAETCFDPQRVQREADEKLETDAVNMIIERIIDSKPSLYWHYTREVSVAALIALLPCTES